MVPAGEAAFLLGAGVLAGIVGTAGAITSLVSYPALLLAGIPPLAAGVANVVALTATWPGSALTSRAELAGRGGLLRRRLPVAALGGVIGAALLAATPSRAFVRIVPVLVLAGSLVLLAAPRLLALRLRLAGGDGGDAVRGGVSAGATMREPAWSAPTILAISVYNGYFGAGAGVMLLAHCLICLEPSLPIANALKNMLIGAATVSAAVWLVIVAHVHWGAVVPLAAGLFLGGALGPPVARRIPERALRLVAAAFGIGLAIQLWVSGGR